MLYKVQGRKQSGIRNGCRGKMHMCDLPESTHHRGLKYAETLSIWQNA